MEGREMMTMIIIGEPLNSSVITLSLSHTHTHHSITQQKKHTHKEGVATETHH